MGHAGAQYNMGVFYDRGLVVPRDDSKMVYWFKKSAEGGEAMGQNGLGDCYRYGQGVKRDLDIARYWYKKAADQGNEDAKKALEEM